MCFRSTVDGWRFARSSKTALLHLENNLLGKIFLVPRGQSSECPFGVPAVIHYAFTDTIEILGSTDLQI